MFFSLSTRSQFFSGKMRLDIYTTVRHRTMFNLETAICGPFTRGSKAAILFPIWDYQLYNVI